ncbi:MAG: glycoside hydrolase family 13 protein [Chloroflexi bacterium]|nr:glycoside hydrolase family 13 protein [Chloroflexota bacterium]
MADIMTPEWVKHAVFYQIFPDRFAKSERVEKPSNLEPWDSDPTVHGYKGGDLLGVAEHLDYLQDLGVTAIYLNPIFQSAANHRYHTQDYYRVDPLLGGQAAFDELLAACKSRGLRVIPQVREFIMSVGEYWIRQGVDGWRLDVPNEISTPGFWQEFRRRVKAINPEAYIVGEIWEDARPWLQGDQFDGVMNYLLTEALIEFVVGPRTDLEAVKDRGYHPQTPIDAAGYADRVDGLLGLYPWPVELAQYNLLDSHDTARFITIARGDEASVRLALLLLFTFPGAPSVYYGDEIGLTGGLPDQWARKSFPWDQPDSWNHGLLHYYKEMIRLRKAHPALRTGLYHRLYAGEGVYAFVRELDGERLVVAVNVDDAPRTARLDLPSSAEPWRLNPLFGAPRIEGVDSAGLTVSLEARRGAILDVSA